MATNVDVNIDNFMSDLKDILNDLEKEEQIEQQIIEEQKDAEEKLAEALRDLTGRDEKGQWSEGAQGALQALIQFRDVNFDAPHAEVHQQVEQIIKNSKGINDAAKLQSHLQDFHHGIGNIERALEELQDVYQRTSEDAEHQKADVKELREIQQVVGKLQQGAQRYSKWAQGER
ncbi:hypothetical protein GKQ38_05145 [Candidatus Nanohaloarchaea archaeon]|nr:hypothetical protein GKQ38_05145 [Candidatus Nanohaloarchaea archaeon]